VAPPLERGRAHDVDVVIDRLVVDPDEAGRLADSVELALARGGGEADSQAGRRRSPPLLA